MGCRRRQESGGAVDGREGGRVFLGFDLPCLALPCLALPCLALPCLALPCPDLPHLESLCRIGLNFFLLWFDLTRA